MAPAVGLELATSRKNGIGPADYYSTREVLHLEEINKKRAKVKIFLLMLLTFFVINDMFIIVLIPYQELCRLL